MWIFLTRIEEIGLKKRDTEKGYGRYLLASAMDKLFGITPEFEDVQVDGNGKPYFSSDFIKRLRKHTGEEGKTCYFNLSHSGGYVICVVSETTVGCDIQKVKKIPRNLYSFLASVNDEQTEVENMTAEERTQLWTRYESIAKYIGCGIPINEEVLLQYKKACEFSSCLVEDYVITVCGEKVDADCAIERVVLPGEMIKRSIEIRSV